MYVQYVVCVFEVPSTPDGLLVHRLNFFRFFDVEQCFLLFIVGNLVLTTFDLPTGYNALLSNLKYWLPAGFYLFYAK